MQGFLDHIVLNIEDDDTMLDFYANVLRLKAERLEEYRAGEAPFPSVRINEDTVIDLFPKKLWESQAPSGRGFDTLNHFCLSLSRKDWDELHSRLLKHKVAITDGPVQRWGARGSGTSIYFSDPEGNTIEARYYAWNEQSKPCFFGT